MGSVATEALSKSLGFLGSMVRDGVAMPEPELTIEQMEVLLGFDKVKPIVATPSDSLQLDENAQYFREWYKEELRELLKRSGKNGSRG